MAEKSYAFAVGNIRARENRLLKQTDIEQLLSFNNAYECAVFLKDKGYGENNTDNSVSSLLSSEEKKLWSYIKDLAPDFSVFDAFVVVNDFHNLKAVIKGTATGKPFEHLLISPSLIDHADIINAVTQKNFSLLPEFLQDAAQKSWEILIKTRDSQASDAVLDATCLEVRYKAAKEIKIPMLKEMVNASVFFDNIKVALRCASAKKSRDFIQNSLIDTDVLNKADLVSAALQGTDAVLELLEKVSVYSGVQVAEAFKTSPSQFEKFVDNYMMRVAIKGKYIPVGAEPLIAYLQAKLAELKTVRIAVNAVSSSADRNTVREMLRELYG
ncbi:MAG: V-type ATPase subunit [Clostridia bacterium]|nr:V-type ATPase subunit [Clostridia bacterium]